MKARNIANQKFGKLTAVRRLGASGYGSLWLFECECGRWHASRAGHVVSGKTTSCGCARAQSIATINSRRATHRMSETSEYRAYVAARQRCRNPKDKSYINYGSRGIKFLFASFAEFFSELGPRPPGKSVDRIDNNGHYAPGNVRWATHSEQQKNKRPKWQTKLQ